MQLQLAEFLDKTQTSAEDKTFFAETNRCVKFSHKFSQACQPFFFFDRESL